MRTEKEIKAEIRKGEAFIKKYPRSMFGDDNVKQFQIFMKIIEKHRRGESRNQIEGFIDDAYGSDNDVYLHASATLNWLYNEEEEIY